MENKKQQMTPHIKARNPFAQAAWTRAAGQHRPAKPARQERRQFRRQAASMLARADRGGDDA